MDMPRVTALALALSLVFVNLTGQCCGQLQFGFYSGKCVDRSTRTVKDVERTVAQEVAKKFANDRTIVAALLRMHFHDCFVSGCDASLLLDGANTEKKAPPNLSVRGFEIIDDIKTIFENSCPGVVACADIIEMATRDSVALSNGGFAYPVQTGRRDSLAPSQNVNLPSPSMTIPQAVAAFNTVGLNTTDFVYLLGGGHSVGIAHCALFESRLYNFQNSGSPDPTMNTTLLNTLRSTCPQNAGSNKTADLDQNLPSAFVLDKSFYQQIRLRNGILQIDQELELDSMTQSEVLNIVNGNDFFFKFGRAMIKLGAVNVKTGNQGEIRRSCRAVNPPSRNFGGNGNFFGDSGGNSGGNLFGGNFGRNFFGGSRRNFDDSGRNSGENHFGDSGRNSDDSGRNSGENRFSGSGRNFGNIFP